MNTILVTGTSKVTPVKISHLTTAFKVEYSFIIWASKTGQPLEYIRGLENVLLTGYPALWDMAKKIVIDYYKDDSFSDGAYTQYLDSLSIN